MSIPGPRSRLWPALVLLAIVLMCARIAPTWSTFSDTADEPYHIGAAISIFEAHKLIEGVQHPPLARLLPGLVLWTSGCRYPPDHDRATIRGDLEQLDAYNAGEHVLFNSPISYWQVLLRARPTMLIFPIVAVIYVYLLGRWLLNRRAAAIAAVFFSFDPTLLGHSSWIATDVAAAAGFLAVTYHAARWIARPTTTRAIITGVALGLAISCKYSCLIAIPAIIAMLAIRRRFWRHLVIYLRRAALAAAVAFFVLWATYLFNVGTIGDAAPIPGSSAWAHLPAWLKSTPLPMPSFFYGLLVLNHHENTGHIAYALGRHSLTGWWWYFPFTILVKEPVALLIAIIAAICIALASLARPVHWRRAAILFIPFALFMLASMLGHIDIGIRHILPAIALLYPLTMLALARAPRPTALFAALALLAGIETAWIHPDYLAFFNLAAGGPLNGQRWLLDSNLDWGQDQARLYAFLNQFAAGRDVTLRVFASPNFRKWPHPDKAHGGFDLVPQDAPIRGLLAVSKNQRFDLYPSVFEKKGRRMVQAPLADMLKPLRPNIHIGYSIDIYDTEHPLASQELP